jgi:Na+-transporting NADH:ubiquinone oxidoreductase subunit NqrC
MELNRANRIVLEIAVLVMLCGLILSAALVTLFPNRPGYDRKRSANSDWELVEIAWLRRGLRPVQANGKD